MLISESVKRCHQSNVSQAQNIGEKYRARTRERERKKKIRVGVVKCIAILFKLKTIDYFYEGMCREGEQWPRR